MNQSPKLDRYAAAVIQPSGLLPDQLKNMKAVLLSFGYAVGNVDGVGLLIANLHADNIFFEKLAKLTQYFSLAPALSYPLGGERPASLPTSIEALDTRRKHGWLGAQAISLTATNALRQAGLLNHDKVGVLDEEFPLRLAYFIRGAAASEIEQPDTPDLPHEHHVFTVDGRQLVITGMNRFTSGYLLRLRAAISGYLSAHPGPWQEEEFEEAITRIAEPLRHQTGNHLSQVNFWEEDSLL